MQKSRNILIGSFITFFPPIFQHFFLILPYPSYAISSIYTSIYIQWGLAPQSTQLGFPEREVAPPAPEFYHRNWVSWRISKNFQHHANSMRILKETTSLDLCHYHATKALFPRLYKRILTICLPSIKYRYSNNLWLS